MPEFAGSQSLPTDPPGAMRGPDFFTPRTNGMFNFDSAASTEPVADPGKMTPEQIAAFEGLGGGFMERSQTDPEEYMQLAAAELIRTLNITRDAEGSKLTPEAREEMVADAVEKFDYSILWEIDKIVSHFENLYTPGEWELQRELEEIRKVKNKFMRKLAQEQMKEEKNQDPFKIKVLEAVARKTAWAHGKGTELSSNVIFTSVYYAGEQALVAIPRIKTRAENFIDGYSTDCFELKSSNEEIRGFVTRERIIEMQDDAFKLNLMVASVGQKSYEEIASTTKSTFPRERKSMPLTDKEINFIVEVFGTRDGQGKLKTVEWIDPKTGKSTFVPEEILNYFTMTPTPDNKKKFFALASTILEGQFLTKLESKDTDPKKLAEEVRNKANSRISEPVKKYTDNLKMYSEQVMRVTIANQLGSMTSPELGWAWKYDKRDWDSLQDWEKKRFAKSKRIDEETGSEYVIVRTLDVGSIYSAGDSPTPFFQAVTVVNYQSNGETTSGFPAGTSDRFRRETFYRRPDEWPDIDEYLEGNSFLKQEIDDLRKGKWESRVLNSRGSFGEMDPRLKAYILKYLRAWPTWVVAGRDQNGEDVNFAIPLMFPPVLYSLNLWRAISSDPSEKIHSVPSLYERFMEGMKMSDIKFDQYNDHVNDWEGVNRAQAAKFWVMYFLNPNFTKEAGNAVQAYLSNPLESDPMKDWLKRGRLIRGEDAEQGMLAMVTLAPSIVKAIGDKLAIIKLGFDGVLVSEKEKTSILDNYKEAIATVMQNAVDLPNTKGVSKSAIKNFGKSLAMLIDFYGEIYLKWCIMAGQQHGSSKRNLRYTSVNDQFNAIFKKTFS